MGHCLDGHSEVKSPGGDGLLMEGTNGRNGDDELLYLLGFNKLRIEHRTGTHHGSTIKFLVNFRHIVVNESNDTVLVGIVLLEGIGSDETCGTSTIDNNINIGAATTEEFIIDAENMRAVSQKDGKRYRIWMKIDDDTYYGGPDEPG